MRLFAAGELLDRVEADTVTRRASAAGELVDRMDVDAVARRVSLAGDLVERLDAVLTPERLAAAGAAVDRLSELLSFERVARLAALVDQASRLVHAPEAGDLPTSRELRQLPPDLHAALQLIDELHQVVTGMPGARRARDRGAEPHPQV